MVSVALALSVAYGLSDRQRSTSTSQLSVDIQIILSTTMNFSQLSGTRLFYGQRKVGLKQAPAHTTVMPAAQREVFAIL